MNITCFYHNPCRDGFGAALAFFLAHRHKSVNYLGVNYGQEPDVYPQGVVYLVDFTFQNLDWMRKLIDTAECVVVFDHHLTAKDILDTLKQEYPIDKLKVHYDIERSGVGLVWDFFHGHIYRPAWVNYIEDRDLWRFRYSQTKAFNEGILTLPQTFSAWEEAFESVVSVRRLMITGEVRIEERLARCREMIQRTWQEVDMEHPGHPQATLSVPFTQAMQYSDFSEQTSLMLEMTTADIVGCWIDKPDSPVQTFRLTAREGSSCEGLARHYGGGGHPGAAGFRLPKTHSLVKALTT